MHPLVYFWMGALAFGLLIVALFIAIDRKRYLTQFDFAHWHERTYLSRLPNFLQALYDAQLNSPWPNRLNTFSAAIFHFKVRTVLRRSPAIGNKKFLAAHLNLFAFLAVIGPYIHDAVLGEKVKIASGKLLEVSQGLDRERLARFVHRAISLRQSFEQSLSPLDRMLRDQLHARHFLATLKKIHSIFSEHGFMLLTALEDLARWEVLDAQELGKELMHFDDVRLPASQVNIMLGLGDGRA